MNVYNEPLFHAVINGDIRKVDLHLTVANVNMVDLDYNRSILIWASMLGYLKIMELLLDIGADTGSAMAYATGRVDAVKLLIRRGADVNARDENGATALINAAAGGRMPVVRMLTHADVNMRDDTGESAIGWAVMRGDDDMIKLLIDNGATTDGALNTGAEGRIEMVKLMMKHDKSYEKDARAIQNMYADVQF